VAARIGPSSGIPTASQDPLIRFLMHCSIAPIHGLTMWRLASYWSASATREPIAQIRVSPRSSASSLGSAIEIEPVGFGYARSTIHRDA